ncbi:MAG TPA: MFS transporter [Candidatus Baltobacteraceae bacterium]|nr:MFS transporter [Candidatus Baltobacteraceae bacterium]
MDTRRARSTLLASCTVHFLHDGCAELLYPLFPIWAREFGLSFAQVGLLRSGYSGALAAFQIPAGFLAERYGETRILVAGTLLTAIGFLTLGTAAGFATLLAFLILGGLGSGTQHPLASALVSRAYEEGPRRAALGTYNFSGDLGKIVWTSLAAFLAAWVGWRWATRGIGSLILLSAFGLLAVLGAMLSGPAEGTGASHTRVKQTDWGIRDAGGFRLLATIHGIDNGSRTAFLTFLPFLLIGKGMRVELTGVALALTLAGGATGKFVCGIIAERLGIIRTVILTEAATGLGILLVMVIPYRPALIVLPLLGIALNGTSSVLYGTVAELVHPERRSRVYGLFYTIGIGAGAVAPPIFGTLSDWTNLSVTLVVLSLIVLAILPLAAALQKSVAR